VFPLGQLEQNQKTSIINLPESIAFKISKAGYGVITGGGPGIMEAGNRGTWVAEPLVKYRFTI
jgi:predicted Rossmann-fold nucleotide-binding protein